MSQTKDTTTTEQLSPKDELRLKDSLESTERAMQELSRIEQSRLDILKGYDDGSIEVLGRATDRQLEDWKKTYGRIHMLLVPLDDAGKRAAAGYFKPFNRDLMRRLPTVNDNLADQFELVCAELWLGGYDGIRKEEELFVSAAFQMQALLATRIAAVKKL